MPTVDRLRWYCRSGKHEKPHIIREVAFHVTDLGTQLKKPIQVRYEPSRIHGNSRQNLYADFHNTCYSRNGRVHRSCVRARIVEQCKYTLSYTNVRFAEYRLSDSCMCAVLSPDEWLRGVIEVRPFSYQHTSSVQLEGQQ